MITVLKDFGSGKLIFDSSIDGMTSAKVQLVDEEVEINFERLIDTMFSLGNCKNELEQLRDYFRLGNYPTAPCGGFPNFYHLHGSNETPLIVYSGIREDANSHFKITLHSIIQL